MSDDVEQGKISEVKVPSSYESHIPVMLSTAADAAKELARMLLGDAEDIGLMEFRICAYLAERSGGSISQISRDLQVDKAWVSRLLQQLTNGGFVEKRGDSSDSRLVLAHLTPEGASRHERMISKVSPYYDLMVADVDHELATSIIRKLTSNMQSLSSRLRSERSRRDPSKEQGPE